MNAHERSLTPRPAWAFVPTNVVVDMFKLDETRSGTRSGRRHRQTDDLTPAQKAWRLKNLDSTGSRRAKRKRGPDEEDAPAEEEVVVVTDVSPYYASPYIA